MQIAPEAPMPVPDWQQFVVAVHVAPTASQLLLLLLLLLLFVPLSWSEFEVGSTQSPSEHTRAPLQSPSVAHRSAVPVAQATAPSPTKTTANHCFPIT